MKELYNSSWILPMLPWLVAPITLFLGLRARGVLGWLVAGFSVEIALDAWLTGPLSPVHAPPAWDWVVPVVFVILGDLRYFAVVEHCVPTRSRVQAGLVAVALAFVVPVATQVARVVSPRVHDDATVNYLVYELLFLALAVVFRVRVVPRRTVDAPGRSLALRLTEFEIVQYGLWACADVILISGHLENVGWALRIVPNVLYYVLFLPCVLWLSRAPGRKPEATLPSRLPVTARQSPP